MYGPALLLKVIKLSGMSLGLSYFISLVILDSWNALRSKPRTWWIPGKNLILTALSIQILSYLDYGSISISEVPHGNHSKEDPKKILDKLLDLAANQFAADSGRLVTCVMIGYLLPGMATPGSREAYGKIAAVLVSLFAAVAPELYFARNLAVMPDMVDDNHETTQDDVELEIDHLQYLLNIWFFVSSSVFLLATVLLILLLVSAILAGKTVRCMLEQRVNSAISFNKPHKAEECWERFDDEALKSWFLCRAAQPQCVIARSVLSSSTGLMVTTCIVVFVAKILVLGFHTISSYDGLDGLRSITLGLQCLFVLLGWLVILRRWFMAVIYFPILCKEGVRSSLSFSRCSVEDFWTRSILELIDMYDLQQWRRDQKSEANKSCCDGVFMKVLTTFKLHKSLYSLWAVQKLVVWFSKCCWAFSEILFGSMFMRRVIIRNDLRLFYDADPPDEDKEFKKHKEEFEQACMPGENPASLWLTDKDSIDQAKGRITDGGNLEKCQELIDIVKKSVERPDEKRFLYEPDDSLPLVKQHIRTHNENWWKMTAVSLLIIIMKLDPDGGDKDRKAYKQAWDLMSFVESYNKEQLNSINVIKVFNFEAHQVSLAADKKFKNILENPPDIVGDSSKRSSIEEELEEAKSQLIAQNLWTTERGKPSQDMEKADLHTVHRPQDSKDWYKIVPSVNMYRVCTKLQSRGHRGRKELVDDLHMCLGDVIADCVEHLPSILVRSFGEWALQFKDDNMWEALHIAGKCKRVVEECGLKPNWKTPEQKMSLSTEG